MKMDLQGNSDSNLQRRRTDPHRQCNWHQEPWESSTANVFCGWITHKATDLDLEIRRTQQAHDQVALALLKALRFPEETCGSWPSQTHNNTLFRTDTEKLLLDYELFGQRLRVMRHVEKLLAPISYAAAFNDNGSPISLPYNDCMTLTFFEEFLKDAWHPDFFDRRKT